MKSRNWHPYVFEFISIFVAVIAAFGLERWNQDRLAYEAQIKILREIANGLEKDKEDVLGNLGGHYVGIGACQYWRKVLFNEEVNQDSLLIYYFSLTRDYISIQNRAGYESLKSRGLGLIRNDSLRLKIIRLYEYDFNVLRKMEEEYHEGQFHQSYFLRINELLAPYFQVDSLLAPPTLAQPIAWEEATRKELLLILWRIQRNRVFTLDMYKNVDAKIDELIATIRKEIH